MHRAVALLSLLGVAACTRASGDIDAGVRDAGHDAAPLDSGADSGSDAGTDAGHDAGHDAGTDAGIDAATDAGPPFAPTIDGLLGAGEWDAATVVRNSVVPSAWTSANELHALYAKLAPDGLYVAIDGQIAGGNAIVSYVDVDLYGGTSGTGVTNLASLTDGIGTLDDAVSAGFTTPFGFGAEWAFGTTSMSRSAATSTDDQLGWRDIVTAPADFGWYGGPTSPAVCGATACEAFLPRATLGGPAPPRTVSIFVRIVNHDGTMSPDQCLPEDAPATPRTVAMLLSLSE